MKSVTQREKELLQWSGFFTGLIITALGSVFMINAAGAGVQPFDVLYIGIHQQTALSIGKSAILIGILLVIVTWWISKTPPKSGTFLETIGLGTLMDLFLALDFVTAPKSFVHEWLYVLLGIMLIGFGASLVVVSKRGSGPVDNFMLALHYRFRVSVKKVITYMECVAILIGMILGGPIGAGTFVFCFLIGPVMEYSIAALRKLIAGQFCVTAKKEQPFYEHAG